MRVTRFAKWTCERDPLAVTECARRKKMPVFEVGSQADLDSKLSSDSNCVFIVKMGATWCRPCQEMDEPLRQLSDELASREHNATFLCVNREDDTEELFDTHEITKLPTLLLFKAGEVTSKLPRPDMQQLRDVIEKLLPDRKLVLDEDF